jgi:AraC-like DNA-binding protein
VLGIEPHEKLILQDDAFYAAPSLSGSGFEDLLASFGQHRYFKPSAPNPGTSFHWRSDIGVGSGITVWRTRYSADWCYSSETSAEDLGLAFLSSGAADMVIGSKNAQRTPTNVALMPLATLRQHKIRAIDGSYANVMLRFDASVVAKMLTAMFDGPALTKLDLAPTINLSTGAGQLLQQIASTIVSGMHEQQLLKRSPKAMALLAEATLQLIFENVPHRLIDRLDRRPPDVTPKHIKQAIDYMHANLYLPLTIIDIADAIGVSERSLQLGFRKVRNMTPAAYLRRIRLDAVYAELSRPENRLPVHEVALKWGFAHMGRFAAQYRAVFGVYPSETVKRALAAY